MSNLGIVSHSRTAPQHGSSIGHHDQSKGRGSSAITIAIIGRWTGNRLPWCLKMPHSTTKSKRSTKTFFFCIVLRQINYNFVVGMYTIASVIFVMLLILDKVVEVPQVEGFWIIFAPFIPCLLVSLVVRSRWLRRRSRKVPSKEE